MTADKSRDQNLTESFNRSARRPRGWEDGFFTNADNQKIRYAHIPANGESRGTVVLTHGYGEFIDLYYESIKEYQARGFDVWAMDWQGFGASERDNPKQPRKSDNQGMDQHVRDLDRFVKNVVKHDRDTPLIMSTHSMGGHPGMLYLQRNPGVFDAAVMSAPMLDIYKLGMKSSLGSKIVRGIFNAASHVGLHDTPVPALSGLLAKTDGWRDESGAKAVPVFPGLRQIWNQAARAKEPGFTVSRPTFGWVDSVFKTVREVNDPVNLRKVTIPVLIGSAGHENLVDNAAHVRAAAAMPNARHVTLPTAAHGLWFEPEPNYTRWAGNVQGFLDDVMKDFYAARNRPVPPPPSPADDFAATSARPVRMPASIPAAQPRQAA